MVKAPKVDFDHFSKCSKNRSKRHKILKNTSFESYGIVLLKKNNVQMRKKHTEAAALRKCYMTLVKW